MVKKAQLRTNFGEMTTIFANMGRLKEILLYFEINWYVTTEMGMIQRYGKLF